MVISGRKKREDFFFFFFRKRQQQKCNNKKSIGSAETYRLDFISLSFVSLLRHYLRT